MIFKERRRAQRVDANLAITVCAGPAEASGTILNISTNGVYFRSPYFMEPLTKVQLRLLMPEQDQTSVKETTITCDGVVVRVVPEREDTSVSSYEVAVFFTNVPESSQETLANYIKSRLSA